MVYNRDTNMAIFGKKLERSLYTDSLYTDCYVGFAATLSLQKTFTKKINVCFEYVGQATF